jgi:betaine-aldehyde dehydrogenase
LENAPHRSARRNIVRDDYDLYIDGTWVPAGSDDRIPVIDPSNGREVATVAAGTEDDVRKAVDAASAAFKDGRWSRLPHAERARVLLRVADLIEERLMAISEVESVDAGKPIKLTSNFDVPFGADNVRFFAGAARLMEGKAAAEYSGEHLSYLRRDPMGVIAAICPWNYPFQIEVWKIFPAMAVGNTVVMKPAKETPLSAFELALLCEEAGMPPGVINVVTGRGAEIGTPLIQHPDVRMVCLTGDTETGKTVMRAAADGVKRLHLELGGKAPFIVFDDADLEAAIRGAVAGAYINCGQDCTAATRAYVQEPLYEDFVAGVADLASGLQVGPTLDPATDMGPLITSAQREGVHGFVERATKEGARVVTGGTASSRPGTEDGWYYEPTVVVDADQRSEIVQREIFGPVLVALPFREDDEAIAMSNDVEYGLSSSVWTRDIYRAMDASRRLEFGNTWINEHIPIVSEMPHGGVKGSGFGKDMSMYALEEFTTVRHVMADITGTPERSWHGAVMGGAQP